MIMKHLFICAAMVTMGLLSLTACRTQKVLIHGPEGNIAYKMTLPEGFDTATAHKSSPTRWSFSMKCSGGEGELCVGYPSDGHYEHKVHLYCFPFSLYSIGDIPVCALKYLRKVNCSGKPNSSATCLTRMSGWRSKVFAWLIVTILIHSIGV